MLNAASAPCSTDITVLHQDDSLLVLNKPAGLLSVPGRGPDKQDCLSARVQRQFPDALIVHRLDMATSGLLLMARGTAAQRQLSQAFAQRLVDKKYVAIVDGHLAPPAADWGLIDLPIAVDWPRRPLRIIDAELGKLSQTRWRVLAQLTLPDGQAATRIELEPVTGRSHQLRVHMQAMGHAMVGDALYASAAVQARADRLLLHASSLSFLHPLSSQRLSVHSPPDF